MQLQENVPDSTKEIVKQNKAVSEKDNFQYNSQDLDQEQHAELNPTQNNKQNVHVYISNEKIDYSAQITGITIFESNREIVPNVNISLFFGHDCTQPILKISSDESGNFLISDLPPGFYIIKAIHSKIFQYRSPFIKVLPCQNISHTVMLR